MAEKSINTKTLIDNHQLCIEILEGISHFQSSIRLKKESLNGFAGTFYELRIKYAHNIDIYNRCINRLNQRYNNILNNINHE